MRAILAILFLALLTAEAAAIFRGGGTTPPVPPVLTTYNAYGDSITFGALASVSANAYVNLLMTEERVSGTNFAVSGAQACDQTVLEFQHENPTVTDQTIRTVMLGTNDANVKNIGSYEAVYVLCMSAGTSWIATPTATKTKAQSCTTTGSWSVDNSSYFTGYGRQSTTSGSTLSCSLATQGSPIYLWYLICDTCTGTFTYSVDGGGTTSVNNKTTPLIATQNGGTQGIGVVRIAGLSSGSHTVLVTTVGAGNVSIAGIGTPDLATLCCYALISGVVRQRVDANAVATATYDTDVHNVVLQLAGDGLQVTYAPTRTYLGDTTATMADGLHPNDAGHRQLANAFESVWP